MKMPIINQCEITQCAYNRERKCHALAITVGDGDHPHCDTYFQAANKGGDAGTLGRVGACKVSGCVYNKALECSAPGINVGYKDNEVDCLTYRHT